MRPWVVALALWPVLRVAAEQLLTLPSITDKTFIEDCVRVHNELRAKVQPAASNMRYMVVWDHSYKIGCAVTFCKKVAGIQSAANFICNYSPGGNFPRRPYIEGRSCGNCSKGDTCENKLCRNPKCDKIIDYSRWNPPWEVSIACDESCLALVVLRVALLFLAFVIVCLAKSYFTNTNMST